MKFRETFRYEFASHMRSILTWIYFLLLLVMSFFLARDVFIEEALIGRYFLNSPFAVAQVSLITCLAGIWLLAPIAGSAAARDIETRMYPLLYTAPVSKAVYLGGRFLAALVCGVIVMAAIPAGLLGASVFPGEHADLTGPVDPVSYLNSFFLFILPNTFVAVALMFSVSVLSRRTIAGFLVAIFIFFMALASWQVIGVGQDNWALAKLADGLGITLVQELKDLWTPVQKNTLMPGTQTWTILNRIIWCLIALGTLVLTYFRFTVKPAALKDSKSKAKGGEATPPGHPVQYARLQNTTLTVPQAERSFGLTTRVQQVIAVAGESLRVIMSRGWVVFAALALFVILAGPFWFTEYYFVPELPYTGHLLSKIENTYYHAMWFLIPILILYYAGELVWREREARINEITGAAPVPVWATMAGKFAGLFTALVIMQSLMILAGMVVQVRMGYYNFELPLYLKILLGIRLTDYTLLALFTLIMHVLVNQKYLAHLICIVCFVILFYGPLLGIEPGLLVYGSDPGWAYSEIRGLDPYMGPWLLFKLYWAAWALLLAAGANLLWPRGTEGDFRKRLEEGRRRFTRPARAFAAVAGVSVAVLGGMLVYNIHILYPRTAPPDGEEWKAEYERRYSMYAYTPQPWLTATRLRVEIYPEQRAVAIRGESDYINRTASGIDSVHLAVAQGAEHHVIRFDRAATPVLTDDRLGHHIYVLDRPLLPGDSLKLIYHVSYKPAGFPNYGIDASLVKNGSYFEDEWLPKMGYQGSREIDDAQEREKQGLKPKLNSLPAPATARMGMPGQERIAFEAIVATDEGQIAVTQGKLISDWKENGRHYFHYAAEAPIRNQIGFFSADYKVHSSQWRDPASGQTVDIDILHHPGHTLNIEAMAGSIQASLSFLGRQLGPYPHSEIRFLEMTGYNKGMYAHPTTTWYRTGIALLNPAEDPRGVDIVYATAAHEVAHQWWAHGLTPATVRGNLLLTESLAWYSALEAIEEAVGREAFLPYLRMLQQEYFSPQSRAGQALLEANDHTLIYRKGPLALYALREYIGRERVGGALRNLYSKNASGAPPLPVPQDLYHELHKVTPDSLRYLLHDLLAANTFWDLKANQSAVKRTAAGNWELSLELEARKYTIDTLGVEADVPMDDWIEVGLYDAADGPGSEKEPLYLQLHPIRSGRQTIQVTVPDKPAYAGIDPRNLMMDLVRADNMTAVQLREKE